MSTESSNPGHAADAQHKMLGMTAATSAGDPFARTQHPDAQWFPRAGLGLFVHWGISSCHGKADLSWGMVANCPWCGDQASTITPNQYYALADRWNPDRYDPERWLAAARGAGFRYAVLTTKHHDGYTLWPSAYGGLGTHTKMNGRDLAAPFVEACRNQGLKVGLYYSPPDWYFDRNHRSWGYFREDGRAVAGEGLDMDHKLHAVPPKPEGHDEARRELVKGQIRELLTRYGRIDLMWFDGGHSEVGPGFVRSLQPHIVINARMWGVGDYDHTECKMPKHKPEGWFEMCTIWNDGGWGYTDREIYGPVADRLRELCVLRAMGANYLVNVGPRPNGELPETAYARFEEMGNWMRNHEDAVLDAGRGPWPGQANVPVTCGDGCWHAFLFPEFPSPVVIHDIDKPRAAALRGSDGSVAFTYSNQRLEVTVPPGLRSPHGIDLLDIRW